jgi:hypothetical protein
MDVQGNPIVMGPWYWAKNRIGQIVGTGKFASIISRPDDVTFYINGTGYGVDSFTYLPAEDPAPRFAIYGC